jgi:outer membrane protein assembly factor BamB
MNPRHCLALSALLLTGWAARAEDWPQWRGPNRDGVWNETDLLKTFPADGLKIRWRAAVGFGWSSPVVAQGRVFLTDAQLAKPNVRERVLCFDETTGKPLWTFAYKVTYPEWAFVPGQGNGPTATPVVEAGCVFTVGANGHIHCLDTRTGAVIWENNLRKEYEVREMQCRPSPLIDGGRLIVFTGAKPGASVLALDKRTGKEIWKALDDHVSSSSPVVIEAGGQRQLIVWSDDAVTSLNPATGATWWREPMVTSGNDSIPTPVVQKNRLLISGLMLELDSKRPAATALWPTNRAAPKRLLSNTSTPMLRGDYVYSAKSSGELVCLDARTGALAWQTNTVTTLKSGASIHLTPTPEAVLLFTEQGNLIRAQLTPAGYREESRAKLIEPTTPFGGRDCAWSPPAFANRHVFARTEKELVCASLAEKGEHEK